MKQQDDDRNSTSKPSDLVEPKTASSASLAPKTDSSVDRLAHVTFANKVRALLREAKSAGLNVGVFEAARSLERQKWLYENQLSKQDGLGQRSSHQEGTGVDIVFKDKRGEWSWAESEDWEKLGQLGEAVGLVWGGRWNPPVLSHFQESDLFTMRSVELRDHTPSNILINCGGCQGCSS